MKQILFFISILSMIITSFAVKLNVEQEWKYVDFLWDNPQQKQEAINSGDYDPVVINLFDADKAPDGRIFVSAARFKGVPASVMTVTNKTGKNGPLLRPYPDWSWYTKNDCNDSIVAGVYRIYIKCNYLFIMDGGRFTSTSAQICPPKLLVFDLSTDKLIKLLTFPLNISTNKNGEGALTSAFVFATNCTNIINTMTVFMSDSDRYGLAIYNANTSKHCRIDTAFMRPIDPFFTVANQSFYLAEGIDPITIIRNDLYYCATAGHTIYKMKMLKLIECALTNCEATEQTQVAATLSGQSGSMASEKCALFFSNFPKTSIMCADAFKKINYDNMEVVVQDSEKLQTPFGIKYLSYKPEGELLILSNRYQRAATKTRNLNEINFRVLSVDGAEIRKETNCFASCNKY